MKPKKRDKVVPPPSPPPFRDLTTEIVLQGGTRLRTKPGRLEHTPGAHATLFVWNGAASLLVHDQRDHGDDRSVLAEVELPLEALLAAAAAIGKGCCP